MSVEFPLLQAREALVLGLCVWDDGQTALLGLNDFADAFFPTFDSKDGKGFGDHIRSVVEGSSDPVTRVANWATDQGVHEFFDLGRDLRRITWHLGWLSYQLEGGDEDLRKIVRDLEELVTRLKKHRLIAANHYLSGAINYYKEFIDKLRQGLTDDGVSLGSMIDGQVASNQPRLIVLGVGIGELVGVLRDEDRQRQYRDAEKVSPRGLWIAPDESVDILRGRVLAAERSLAGVEDAPYLPIAEHSIGGADDVIDALMKRLWPAKEISAAGGTRQFLGNKLGQRNPEPVHRFAAIATNLHLSYRNPSSHEASTFRCSLREAKYVLCGIHVLIDLHDEILEQQLT
jgi:hypothetical protein